MNPYQPPQFDTGAGAPPGASSEERQRLLKIAQCQRNINLVVLAYFGAGFMSQPIKEMPGGQIIIGLVGLGVIIAGAVFAVQMASALWNTGAAVLCAILLLIPCVGLLTLLVLNSRATSRLRDAGCKVGFLGAEPDEVRRHLGL